MLEDQCDLDEALDDDAIVTQTYALVHCMADLYTSKSCNLVTEEIFENIDLKEVQSRLNNRFKDIMSCFKRKQDRSACLKSDDSLDAESSPESLRNHP